MSDSDNLNSDGGAVVISANNLGKAYHIFKKPADRLKQMLFRGRRTFYEEYWALQNVSFEIRRGESIGIVGRNGAGKSTLLQMICGTLQPNAGALNVQGRVAALLELGAGFNPEFTGSENVYLAATVLGLTTKQINERYESILEFAAIGDFIKQPVKLYSSGMYARLAFAVAAHVDADILIIDEILAVGDAAFTQKCMRYINNFRKRGTLLFVSHDTSSVVSMCDRAFWLDAGSLREVGIAKDVCHNYIASISSEGENSNAFKIGGSRKSRIEPKQLDDYRKKVLKESIHRNEVQVFNFDPDAPWYGLRHASIENVWLEDAEGNRPVVLEGGEEVLLKAQSIAHKQLVQPIVGFFVKNKLGQYLFGDNSYLSYCTEPLTYSEGDRFVASFRFQMPYLPAGDYSVLVAIAEGTQAEHEQHHWIDDALFFTVHASHVAKGLVGIPMHSIEISLVTEAGNNLSESMEQAG